MTAFVLGFVVIRFNCPNCGREYEVHPALAHLPLLCKKCGERIPVPDAPPPPPPEPPRPRVARTASAAPPTAFVSPPATPPAPVREEPPESPPVEGAEPAHAQPLLTPESLAALDVPRERPAPPRVSRTQRELPSPAAPPSRIGRTLLAFVVDALVVVLLIAGGGFLGEMLAGKPTREIWQDAGSSVKFPPIDLLMWLAPPVLFVLVYVLLLSRGKGLGSRWRRE